MAEIIHGKSHDEKTFTPPPALSTTFRTEAPAYYSGSDADESDLDSESSDGFEWLDRPQPNIASVEHQQFNIGNLNIDIGSPFFLDYLSDQPQTTTMTSSAAPSLTKPADAPSSLVPDESE
jgi:hypothetical protein